MKLDKYAPCEKCKYYPYMGASTVIKYVCDKCWGKLVKNCKTS